MCHSQGRTKSTRRPGTRQVARNSNGFYFQPLNEQHHRHLHPGDDGADHHHACHRRRAQVRRAATADAAVRAGRLCRRTARDGRRCQAPAGRVPPVPSIQFGAVPPPPPPPIVAMALEASAKAKRAAAERAGYYYTPPFTTTTTATTTTTTATAPKSSTTITPAATAAAQATQNSLYNVPYTGLLTSWEQEAEMLKVVNDAAMKANPRTHRRTAPRARCRRRRARTRCRIRRQCCRRRPCPPRTDQARGAALRRWPRAATRSRTRSGS